MSNVEDESDNYDTSLPPGLDQNITHDLEALLLPTNVWTVPVNGYISPVKTTCRTTTIYVLHSTHRATSS